MECASLLLVFAEEFTWVAGSSSSKTSINNSSSTTPPQPQSPSTTAAEPQSPAATAAVAAAEPDCPRGRGRSRDQRAEGPGAAHGRRWRRFEVR